MALLATIVVLGVAVLVLLQRRDGAYFSEEAVPFRQAVSLWGWGDSPPTANPHFFDYPSLSIYFFWMLQWGASVLGLLTGRYGTTADAGVEFALAPQYLVAAARIGAMAAVALTAWLAWVWSKRTSLTCGVLAALAVCLSPPLIRSVAQLTPEVLMAPIALGGLLVLRQEDSGGVSRPMFLGVLLGALCGTKYSGLIFLLCCVLAVAVSSRPLWRGVRNALIVLGIATLTFLVTTPFAFLAPQEFRRDVAFEALHLAQGHLGATQTTTILAHLRQLLAALGPAIVICLPAVVFLPTLRPHRTGLLLAGAASFVVPVIFARSGGPERYLVPAIPMLTILIWEAAWTALRQPSRMARAFGGLIVVLGLGHLATTVVAYARSSARSPVACMSNWVKTGTNASDIIAAEKGTTAIFDVDDQASLRRSSCYRSASAGWRARAEAAVSRTIVSIPFIASGELFAEVRAGDGSTRRVVVFAPAWKMVPAMYSALDYVGVQFVIRSSGIEDRLLAALGPNVKSPNWLRPSGRPLTICRAAKGGILDDGEITAYETDSRPPGRPVLGSGWWLADAMNIDQSGAGDDTTMFNSAKEVIYAERVRPYVLQLAQGALTRGDAGALFRAARLLLISNHNDVLAVRIALLGLANAHPDSVWDSGATAVVRRFSTDGDTQWSERILEAWGVDSSVASEEIKRFAAWRGTVSRAVPGR